MARKYLITGAQGFTGRYLTAHLLETQKNAEVLGLGRSAREDGFFTHRINLGDIPIPAPVPSFLALPEQRYRYVDADIGDEQRVQQIFSDFQPDTVFHLASGLRADHPHELFRTNVEGTLSLWNAIKAARCGSSTFVFGSSGGVYGSPESNQLPLREETACRPEDLYSTSKMTAEHVSRIMAKALGIRLVVARLFNLVGPGQDERHVCGRFASKVVVECGQSPVLKVGNLSPTRDFIDVRDVARSLVLLANRAEAYGIYNVASGRETSIAEILRITLETTDRATDFQVTSHSDGRVEIPRHYADIERLTKLGFCPKYTIKQSIHDLLAYYLDAKRDIDHGKPH